MSHRPSDHITFHLLILCNPTNRNGRNLYDFQSFSAHAHYGLEVWATTYYFCPAVPGFKHKGFYFGRGHYFRIIFNPDHAPKRDQKQYMTN